MQYVNFFGKTISKLIVGDNAFTGHSYIVHLISDEEMIQYYTAENIKLALKEIEKAGITTMLPLANPYIVRILKEYNEDGGNLQFIWQPYMPMRQDVSMRELARVKGTIGIYHQGTTTDRLYREGNIEQIKENIKMWRELGVPVGLASHQPHVITQCEEEDWGPDFYMTSLHNGTRWKNGEQSGFLTGESKVKTVFNAKDRPLMLNVVKNIKKPIGVYKIFAGGQIFYNKTEEEQREVIKGVYEEIFSVLKPDDFAVFGAFQRDKNQIKENVDLYNEWYQESLARKQAE